MHCDFTVNSHDDLLAIGPREGLPEKFVMQEINRFAAPNKRADELINRSYISDEMKRYYLSSYHYRQSMI